MPKKSRVEKTLPAIGNLTAEECSKLKQALKARESQVEGSVVLQKRAENIKACPHCGSVSFQKWGRYKGNQRFRCQDCAKTFSPITGTPLAGLRHGEKHIANAKHMVAGMTVRKTAEALGVSVPTAFRWRHRFLEAMSQMHPAELSGIVEADETFFKESFKGRKKDMPRPAKHRGEPASQRGLSREQIPVLVARDRSTGKTLTKVLPSRTARDIGKALVPALAMDVVLCSDNASAYRALAKAMKIELRCVLANPKKKRKGDVYHIQNVNAYDSRLKGWMFRFRGVATKNLPNYLGWHRYLDVPLRTPRPGSSWRERWGTRNHDGGLRISGLYNPHVSWPGLRSFRFLGVCGLEPSFAAQTEIAPCRLRSFVGPLPSLDVKRMAGRILVISAIFVRAVFGDTHKGGKEVGFPSTLLRFLTLERLDSHRDWIARISAQFRRFLALRKSDFLL